MYHLPQMYIDKSRICDRVVALTKHTYVHIYVSIVNGNRALSEGLRVTNEEGEIPLIPQPAVPMLIVISQSR